MLRKTICLFLAMLFVGGVIASPAAFTPQHATTKMVPGTEVPETPVPDVDVWFEDFETDPPEWTFYDPSNVSSHWATDDWEGWNGNSWRCFNPNVGNAAYGGYENDWLDFMVSPALTLSAAADSIIFNFWFRAYLEDGNWDGANVWVMYSDTPGAAPEDCQRAIINPLAQSPQYTENDVVAFDLWMPDPGPFPAWAGEGNEPFCTTWTEARFLLNDYASYETVYVAVAFGSDTAYDSNNNPDMFGLQIDDLKVAQDDVTVWFEDADGGNIGGDPTFLTRTEFSGGLPITLQIIDNAANAYSPTHYLGVEEQILEMQDQYAESPEFNMPDINAGESLWLDLYMSIDLEYTNNFPDEFYWRPELYNPVDQTWNPASSSGSYVYVGGTDGEWTRFSESGYTWDWDISYLAGMDDVKLRIYFHCPETPPDFSFFRIDDILIYKEQLTSDLGITMDVPYPTTVDIPVDGDVIVSNLSTEPADNFMAVWDLNGAVYPLFPAGPYSLDPGESINLDLWHPDSPQDGIWLPQMDDIGFNQLNAMHTHPDQIPDNNSYMVELDVLPTEQYEMGCDSRSYPGTLTVTDANDGPVVHLVPSEINPDFFAGMTYDIDVINFRTFFHSAAGGAPANASMEFHIFPGGPTPANELFSGTYYFDVDPGYTGEYMVNFDVSGFPELQNLTGDCWIWAEITDEGMEGYYQPFPYRTAPNQHQANQFFDLQDALNGDFFAESGHHLTATVSVADNEPDVSVNVAPVQDEIPSNGGSLFYALNITSNVDSWIEDLNYWIDVTGPNGGQVQAYRTATFSMWPYREIDIASVENAVPGWLPDGVYVVEAYVGFYPDAMSTDSFTFFKGDSYTANETVTEWKHQVLDFTADEPVTAKALPTEFRVGSIAPNPFNPTTTISLALPETSTLEVTVINVMGQQVATIADGTFSAGNHRLTIDGSSLASGVYFVHANVPGKLNEMRKIVLMK
ncbi:T9SS type A sorting domain-containing protein [bacterium]|nr:T9SS type A sorting domain-containing protein [bacterium]